MNKKSVEPRRTKRLKEVVETEAPKTKQVSVIFTTQNDYNQKKKIRKVINKEKSICVTGKDRKKHLIAFNFQLPIHGYITKMIFFSYYYLKKANESEQSSKSMIAIKVRKYV